MIMQSSQQRAIYAYAVAVADKLVKMSHKYGQTSVQNCHERRKSTACVGAEKPDKWLCTSPTSRKPTPWYRDVSAWSPFAKRPICAAAGEVRRIIITALKHRLHTVDAVYCRTLP